MSVQSFTRRDTEIIERARRKRRGVLVLDEDRRWLSEFAAEPRKLLHSMARRGALIHLGAGRYAIPDIGTDSVAYLAWQPLVHARLSPLGDYYIGFLSALIEHCLTDVGDRSITAAIAYKSAAILGGREDVAGHPLLAIRSTRRVFDDAHGILTVRPSRLERYRLSDPTRTLVDALWRPELCGSTELWVTAWGRAARTEVLDPAGACDYAMALGSSVSRRTALMLELVGHGNVALERLPARVRRADRSVGIAADLPIRREMQIDPTWNTTFNVPRDRLAGWLAYGK